MMTQKIRVFGYLFCLFYAGSLFAQAGTSVAPGGSTALSGNAGGTNSVTPTGYVSSLLNSSVSGGSVSINSSIDASIRSLYTPSMNDSSKDRPDDNLAATNNAGDRPSPFSAAQFPIAGTSQFGVQSGFRGRPSTGATAAQTPKMASRLSEAQAWSGAGSKISSGKDSGQISGSALSAKLQNSGFSSQQAFGAMEGSRESSSTPKLGGKDVSSASYTPYGFPDSTKGSAMLSPPEVDYGEIFAKSASSTLAFALPNLDNREFLAPSLRVGGRRAGGGEQSMERQMMERFRNGSGSMGARGNSSDAMRKLASQGDIDQLRRELKSPLSRPLIKPLETESLHSHSIH